MTLDVKVALNTYRHLEHKSVIVRLERRERGDGSKGVTRHSTPSLEIIWVDTPVGLQKHYETDFCPTTAATEAQLGSAWAGLTHNNNKHALSWQCQPGTTKVPGHACLKMPHTT